MAINSSDIAWQFGYRFWVGFAIPFVALKLSISTPTGGHIGQGPKRSIFLHHTAQADQPWLFVVVDCATEKLPIAVVIVRHVQDGRTPEHLLTAKDSRILGVIEGPLTVETVWVRAHQKKPTRKQPVA